VKHLCHFLVMVLALAAALLMPSQMAHAQIPNAGFENWTAGNPNDWFTNNIPPGFLFVTQSNAAHSGASAVQGTALPFGGFGALPVLISGAGGSGFPINFRPASLHGFYTFTSVGGDFLAINVALAKNGQGIGGGSGLQVQLGATASYQEFAQDIFYVSADVPDTAIISVLILFSGGPIHAGSTYTIDDLSWGPSAGVKHLEDIRPAQFGLEQNYPNPFNPSTTVKFSIPENGFVTLKIYDVMGREVSTVVEQQLSTGSYETTFAAGSLASGMYLCRLTAGGKVETRRMILMK
jgi:hypothetical protein